MADEERTRRAASLAGPLNPAIVQQRKGTGGRMLSYLPGHVVIDQANHIFGYDGWSYRLADGYPKLLKTHTVVNARSEETTIVTYIAVVMVTVGSTSREDVGAAAGEDTPEGHDTALKGAVTDALRRALRSFGAQFGNSLYGQAELRAQAVRDPETAKKAPPAAKTPPTTTTRRGDLLNAFLAAAHAKWGGQYAAHLSGWLAEKYGAMRATDLTDEDLRRAIAALEEP